MCSLDGEFAALTRPGSATSGNGYGESAYRKHAQERRFPSVLQADHGYIHFCRPVHARPTVNAIRRLIDESCPGGIAHASLVGETFAGPTPNHRTVCGGGGGETYQNRRKSQS